MEQKRCIGCMRLKSQSPICEHCGYDEGSTNESHQLPVGTVLKEQYLIGRTLGQGGFGITYMGWDLYLDIPVAIKEYYPNGMVMRETSVTLDVVSSEGSASSRFRNNRERFLREAKMLARFSQVPEIVQVRNFFLANNTAYIVMEYVEGIDLKRYVRSHGGKLSIEETFTILRPVMEALEKVHRTGLVHRDISPDNIMMLPGGGAKLLDFGAVRDVGAAVAGQSISQSTEAILKQGYAPIEQYQSRGSLGPWTDVYALCATIYFCLTGEIPPEAPERMLGDEELHLREKIPELTEAQEAAIIHGLALRVENRTSSVEMLYSELFAVKPDDEDGIDLYYQAQGEGTVTPEQETLSFSSRAKGATAEAAPGWRFKNWTDPEGHVLSDKPGFRPSPKAVGVYIYTAHFVRERKQPSWKLIIGILAAAAVVLLACLALMEQKETPDAPSLISGTCGVDLTWTLDEQTGLLTVSGSGPMDDFDRYEGDENHLPWYDYREQIKSVKLEGVTRLGVHAFSDCVNLTEIDWGSDLQEIGDASLSQTGFTRLEIPEGVTRIETHAIGSEHLKELILPSTVTWLGTEAVNWCPLLERVEIGADTFLEDGMIGDEDGFHLLSFSADQGQTTPENLTIVTPTGSFAWAYARHYGIPVEETGNVKILDRGKCGDNLNYICYENGVLSIDGNGEMWDFNGSWRLDDNPDAIVPGRREIPWAELRDSIWLVVLSDGVTTIGEDAFEACGNLRVAYLGNSVTSIGFQSLLSAGLETLWLPDSVETIANFSIHFCKNLRALRLPANLEKLEVCTLSACPNLEKLVVGKNTFLERTDREGNTIFTQLESHQDIEHEPPANLTIYGYPGSDAEQYAKEAGFPFAASVADYQATAQGQCGDDVYWLFDEKKRALVLYPLEGTTDGETWHYEISEEDRNGWAKDIPAHKLHSGQPDFFAYREWVDSIVLMPGVEHLGCRLFHDFPNLRSVDFGTALGTADSFIYCGIQEVCLPETMTEISCFAFNECYDLRKIVVNGGQNFVEVGLFYDLPSLEEVWFSGNENIVDFVGEGQAKSPKNPNMTFYVKEDSNALRFAQEHGFSYEIVK